MTRKFVVISIELDAVEMERLQEATNSSGYERREVWVRDKIAQVFEFILDWDRPDTSNIDVQLEETDR